MEISSKLNLKIIQKINSEGVNSALYIVEDEQLNCEMILKQIDKKKLKEYNKEVDDQRYRLQESGNYLLEKSNVYSRSTLDNLIGQKNGSHKNNFFFGIVRAMAVQYEKELMEFLKSEKILTDLD